MAPLRSQRLAAKRNSPLRPCTDRAVEHDRTGRHNNRRQKCSPRKSDREKIGSPSKAAHKKTLSKKTITLLTFHGKQFLLQKITFVVMERWMVERMELIFL